MRGPPAKIMPMDPVKLLAELIAIPSVNPAFLPAGHAQAGEGRVGDYLLATAAAAGLAVDRQEVLPGRANVLARLAPTGRVRRRVILAPHLDTVAATDAAFVPFEKAGRIHGRGACDTKGSLAAMLAAMTAVADRASRPAATEILLVALIDEEHGQQGSRALAASGLEADLAIVGEPTGLRVVTAHKGNLWLRLTTRGRSAHGSLPHLGDNAVHTAARVVALLETEYRVLLEARSHRLLGRPTVNVGAIAGGRQPNIVPDECRLQVDRRTLPGETMTGVRRELQALFRKHELKVAIEDQKGVPCDPLETDPKMPLVQRLFAAAGQADPVGAHFFCDAAVLARGGIPSVVFGPGDIAQAHTVDEWISRRSLERATAILTGFLADLA